MDLKSIDSALSAAGFGQRAGGIAALARPSIRLEATSSTAPTQTTGASRLGGQPDFPGVAWPDKDGASLAFVAQIRLEDVAHLDSEHLLPPSGWLSFFYDAQQQTFGDNPDDRGGWKVFYFPPNAAMSDSIVPSDVPQNARHKPCALTFASEVTVPLQPNLERPQLAWSPTDEKAYEGFLSSFRGTGSAAPRHRLLGYPDTIQDDMRMQCQLMSHGIADPNDPKAAGLKAGANNWILLLQVDSDDRIGMRWGSAGMLYYWIERDALAKTNFDNVWVVLQSD